MPTSPARHTAISTCLQSTDRTYAGVAPQYWSWKACVQQSKFFLSSQCQDCHTNMPNFTMTIMEALMECMSQRLECGVTDRHACLLPHEQTRENPGGDDKVTRPAGDWIRMQKDQRQDFGISLRHLPAVFVVECRHQSSTHQYPYSRKQLVCEQVPCLC